jgi:hypothetical protein
MARRTADGLVGNASSRAGRQRTKATTVGSSDAVRSWLESAARRFRGALVELGTTEVTDIDRVPLPPNLDRLVQQIRRRIGSDAVEPAAGGD